MRITNPNANVTEKAFKNVLVGLVFLELHRKDVLVEVRLHLLVGKVDAKLLEAVHVENLKAENVEHA